MSKPYNSKELKEQALIKAEMLKLCRSYPNSVFIAKKEDDYDWYEIVFSSFDLFQGDEMFDFDKDRIREKLKKLGIRIIFAYSSNPYVTTGDWIFRKR